MPDRCTNPTCEQHWPPVDDPGHVTCEHPSHLCGPTWWGDCELPKSHTGNHRKGDLAWTTTSPDMYRDMIRAKAVMDAAPPNWNAPDE